MTSVETARADRKKAGERLVVAWGVAIVPNTLAAFGVQIDGGWAIVRFGLSAVFVLALLLWIGATWRLHRARRSASAALKH